MSSFDNSKIAQAKTDSEILLDDPRSLKQKKRADKKRRRKYKFSDKHQSKGGIIATLAAILSIALVVFAVVLSVNASGKAGELVGIMPFIALILASIGIVVSLFSFRKTDTIYTFSWIGLIGNIIPWMFTAVMLVIGL